MNNIKVTVLMPVYNCEQYVADAVVSVLDQTYPFFELLIVNDGSTDNTRSIIESFEDTRIRIINQENKGVASALNLGLLNARGEYIARFDADDICMPDRLAKQIDFLDSNIDYIIVGGEAEYILDDGKSLFHFKCLGYSDSEIKAKVFSYCPFIHSSVMYRKDVILNAGGYSIYAHTFEDYLLWVQLTKKGKMANLPLQLIKVRYNPSSVTVDEKWRGSKFRKAKKQIIHKGFATKQDADFLMSIIGPQNTKQFKLSSYHALCAKKFLTDNYHPQNARKQIKEAIKVWPFRIENYLVLLASFLPRNIIVWYHLKSPNKL